MMKRRALGIVARAVAALVPILLYPGAAGAWWYTQIFNPSTDFGVDWARSAVWDGDGNVVVGGDVRGLGLVVVKLDGATGSELWRSIVSGPGGSEAQASAVAVDAAGDVYAAGSLVDAAGDGAFAVVKLDGATGGELWQVTIGPGVANSLVLDPAGALVAAGHLDNTQSQKDLAVVKLDGATGAVLWQVEIDGSGSSTHPHDEEKDEAAQVVVDSAGNPVVIGTLRNYLRGTDIIVLKLDASNGAELWRQEIDGSGDDRSWRSIGSDRGTSVATDASGAVYGAGSLYDASTGQDFAVFKFDGATGTELWRQQISTTSRPYFATAYWETATSVVVGPNGEIVAGGMGDDGDMLVAKLSPSDGGVLWSSHIRGPVRDVGVLKHPIGVDAAGNVYALGDLPRKGDSNLAVAKLDGTTGQQIWLELVAGLFGPSFAGSLAVDSNGEVVAVGSLLHTWQQAPHHVNYDFLVLRLDSTTGAWWDSSLIAKGKVSMSDTVRVNAPVKLKVAASDPSLEPPAPGSGDDPTVAGMELQISNPHTGESTTLLLPATSWAGRGSPAGSAGYVYRDKERVNGPCRRAMIKPGGTVKVVCIDRVSGAPREFTLDEPRQRAVGVTLRLGTSPAHCMWFGLYQIRVDRGMAAPAGGDPSLDARFAAKTTERIPLDCPAP